MRLIQSSGVLVVLSQAWIEELYHQVLERNLLAEAGYWGTPEDHALPLITMLTGTMRPTSGPSSESSENVGEQTRYFLLSDIDGLGSSAIGGQLIRRANSQSPLSCDKASSDAVMAGQ